jgi:mono/diheme cytochrome c family protein
MGWLTLASRRLSDPPEEIMRVRLHLPVTGLLALPLILLIAVPAAAQGGEGDPERGAALFAQNCAVCHGQTGEGRIGAELNDVFVSMSPDAALYQTISEGRAGTFMPAWGEASGGPLTDQDIADIIAYVESWGTTFEPPAPAPPRPQVEIPPVPEVDGDPNNGYTVFQQNCVACHGESGEGRIGANLTAAFAAIEPGAYAISVISEGVDGTLMPAWSQASGGPLSEQEINDAVAYLISIQRHPAPTGGEEVGRGSALPLVIVGVLAVVLIAALGISVNRRQRAEGSGQ